MSPHIDIRADNKGSAPEMWSNVKVTLFRPTSRPTARLNLPMKLILFRFKACPRDNFIQSTVTALCDAFSRETIEAISREMGVGARGGPCARLISVD
ncbi:hypothetical protein EVAR_81610_1 [Eumeta japonica]|uniref:Uncharacterized protein n=1 Tax=Eumeta variegata TaxID=151549 RepID=A0A4C1WDU0_EUMVA|nr:hypothetical protein EVAR_81610_1 [Eumeta japonica]